MPLPPHRVCNRLKTVCSNTLPGDLLPTSDAIPSKEGPQSEWVRQRKANWAVLIKRIYQVDPLLCPKCRSRMQVISVIQDPAVIDKILNHLQWKFQVLPLSTRPPPPASSVPSDFPLDPPAWTEGD